MWWITFLNFRTIRFSLPLSTTVSVLVDGSKYQPKEKPQVSLAMDNLSTYLGHFGHVRHCGYEASQDIVYIRQKYSETKFKLYLEKV